MSDYDEEGYEIEPPTIKELEAEIESLRKQIAGITKAAKITITLENWNGLKKVEWSGYLDWAELDDELDGYPKLGQREYAFFRGVDGIKFACKIKGYNLKTIAE